MDIAQPAGRSASPSRESTREIETSLDDDGTLNGHFNSEVGKPGSRTWPVDRKLARHTLGIILLSVTVLLWTTSNFLASVRYEAYH